MKPLKCMELALLVVSLLLPECLPAQPIWVNYRDFRAISIEILRPDFDGRDNTTFITSATVVNVRLPLAAPLNFVAEVPLAHGDLDFAGSRSETQFGNPYLGLEIRRRNVPLHFELGLRLPLISSNNLATFIGRFADPDRFEAFTPDLLTLVAAATLLKQKEDSSLFFRARGGSAVLINTGGGESEWFLIYGGFAGLQGERARLEAGVTGRLVFTESGDFGARTFFQIGFLVTYEIGRVVPGVHLRLPIDDDLDETIDMVFGLNLEYRLH